MAPPHKFTVVHCKEWISGRKELWMEDNLRKEQERMRRGEERRGEERGEEK